METGTLAELDVKPGDVVEYKDSGAIHTITGYNYDGFLISDRCRSGGWMTINAEWRIISRASDKPKTWGEMTDAEKGALLLAAHEGKVIEVSYKGVDDWEYVMLEEEPIDDRHAYRVKSEPKRETVTMFWKRGQGAFASLSLGYSTHSITFDLIDGEPDVDSIKMERI